MRKRQTSLFSLIMRREPFKNTRLFERYVLKDAEEDRETWYMMLYGLRLYIYLSIDIYVDR